MDETYMTLLRENPMALLHSSRMPGQAIAQDEARKDGWFE